MKNIILALVTFIRMSILKCVYGKKLHVNSVMIFSRKSSLKISGRNSRIDLGRKVDIKENCHLDAIGGKIKLGDNVFINRNGVLVSMNEIYIGSYTTIGPNVVIYDHDHNYKTQKDFNDDKYVTAPIYICDNVWIGANCTILKGVIIGSGAVIAAGTVVSNNVPSGTLFYQKKENVIKKIERR